MHKPRAARRILLGIAAVALALAVIMPAALAGARLLQAEMTAAYPGATLTAEHSRRQWLPTFWLRRDAAYRSSAPFLDIYNYYSAGFHLGPEQHGSGGCILMARSDTTARFFTQDMSVTLCNTPAGRTIFVMRSYSIRLR